MVGHRRHHLQCYEYLETGVILFAAFSKTSFSLSTDMVEARASKLTIPFLTASFLEDTKTFKLASSHVFNYQL